MALPQVMELTAAAQFLVVLGGVAEPVAEPVVDPVALEAV